MRIVVNDIAASCGGAVTILKDFYDYLLQNDHDNEWIFILSDGYIAGHDNIRVILRPDVKRSNINKVIFDLLLGSRFIANLNPDVVLSLQNIITFGLNIPQVVYIHQVLPFQTIKRFSFLKKDERVYAIYQYLIGHLIKESAKKATKIIVQSEWMKSCVVKTIGVESNKIIIARPNIREISQQVLNIKYTSNIFFYPANSAVYKNHDIIYKACEILNDDGCSDFRVDLTISGCSTGNINFVGALPHDEVLFRYRYATLLFPSYLETFGLPLAEARQMNSVILSGDTEFAREILVGYENAYYFNTDNPRRLADLMKKVMCGCITQLHSQSRVVSAGNEWEKVVSLLLSLAL